MTAPTNLIALLCALSQAIYHPEGLRQAVEAHGGTLLRAPPLVERTFRSHYAIVAQGENLIVVLRGTNSWQDWVTNIHTGPARVSEGLYAHRGYWAAVSHEIQSVLLSLNGALAGAEKKNIYFTGHSKGGGEAILAYLWWTANDQHVANNFPRLRGAPVSVVTFGAPLVVMADRPPPLTAIVNYVDHEDIVPKCLARRATWRIRDSYEKSVDLIPTFAAAAPSIWQAVTGAERFTMDTLARSSRSVRDTIVHTVAFFLESLRDDTPSYVPVGRFVELSPKGKREISGEKLLALANVPDRLSAGRVWEMIMAHYPARYVEGVGRA